MMPTMIGQTISHYEVQSEVGGGGVWCIRPDNLCGTELDGD